MLLQLFMFVICPISLPGQLADLVDGWRRASPHSSLKHSLYDPWVLFNYSQSERHVRERAPPAFSSQALQRTEVCISSGTWFALKYILSLHLNWATTNYQWVAEAESVQSTATCSSIRDVSSVLRDEYIPRFLRSLMIKVTVCPLKTRYLQ